jgi:ankyrin repeat protein
VLHYACDHASPRCLQLLLKRVPLSMLDDIDDQGMTPLLWAAHHGHVAHSRLLLARGATPAAIDVQGRSALHFAATQSDAVFVRWLAAAWPAAIGAEDAEGRTPLHMACMFGAFDVAVALLAEMDAMVSCSSARWLPALRDACGRTPLHCAAVVGHTPLVKELVRRGHTPRVVDVDGYDPEYYARLQGHQLTAEALAHASSVVGCLPLDNRAVAMCH